MKHKRDAARFGEMIAIGKVSRSVGIRGELNVVPFTDDLSRFAKLQSVWLGVDETSQERYAVVSARVGRSSVILKLGTITSRTEADSKRGAFVYIPSEEVITPAQGAYFIHDIVGMHVLGEGGESIGVVKEVLELPANDVWVVVKEGKEFLIPAIKQVILSVDLKRRAIVIHALEGLLE
jgi:16S rRNA processing protein RimM